MSFLKLNTPGVIYKYMAAKDTELDTLIIEALLNARQDRTKTLEAYENMKSALKLESDDDVQKTMLVGQKAVDLLEQLTRSNEQIVRLAQIIERKEARKKEEKRKPIDLNDLKEFKNELEESYNEKIHLRVEND